MNDFSDSTFKTDFKLPRAGLRYYNSASIYDQESRGYYWSSSPYGSDNPNYARRLFLDSASVRVDNYYFRALGYSVRCFKDSPKAPETLILTFDINGGELS